MRPTHKALAFSFAALLFVVVAIFLGSRLTSSQTPDSTTPTVATKTEQAAITKKSTPVIIQKETVSQQYGQGLYQIQSTDYETASLTKQFPFISDLMQPHYDDAGEVPSAYPSTIKVADMLIKSKNLRLVALYKDSRQTCDRGFCPFDIYFQKDGQWQGVLSELTTANQYLLVDGDSLSLIVCRQGRHGYIQYRLPDGRLEKPITVNDGEYFKPIGPFANSALAECK